jgi:hypothetical protein
MRILVALALLAEFFGVPVALAIVVVRKWRVRSK